MFDALLDRTEAERRAWFSEAGVTDPDLAYRVAALLEADERAGELLPTTGLCGGPGEELVRPERVGAYRLVRLIGRGGMGEVYLGVRQDGLFEHKVAVKLIAGALASPDLARRFSEERAILASLNHPNIAQLFDGGEDPSGFSFIIMEHLNGEAITADAQRRSLKLAPRLDLFRDACAAVQFAHQNLIVHADIKPSNIVVTPQGLVKLLDFGIARFIDPTKGLGAAPRALEPMTRAYASPERRLGAPPSVASDVYALGVLLYELLVGALPPSETPGRTAPRDGLSAPGPIAPRASAAIGVGGALRPRQVRGDLDAIVMKAMAEDPARRYASVADLMTDLDRFRADQAVSARPDTALYRSKKFISRHRAGLSLTAVGVLILAGVAANERSLYLRSERSRTLVERRFNETQGMADYMIADVDEQLARLPGTLTIRRGLVSKGRDYLKALQADHPSSRSLRLDIAKGYLRLARIYGLDPSGSLGDMPAARESLKAADDILSGLAREAPDDLDILRAQADAGVVAATAVLAAPGASSVATARGALNLAVSRYRRVLAHAPTNVDAALGLWRADLLSARMEEYLDQPKEALKLVTPQLANAAHGGLSSRQQVELNFLSTASELILAECKEALGDYAGALQYYRRLNADIEALKASGMAGVDNEVMQSSALKGIGLMLTKMGRYWEAIAVYDGAIRDLKKSLSLGFNADMQSFLDYAYAEKAGALSRAGRTAEARAVLGEAIASTRRAAGAGPHASQYQRVLAIYLGVAAGIEERAGDRSRACAAVRTALRQWARAGELKALVPIDTAPTGPIERLRARLKACG